MGKIILFSFFYLGLILTPPKLVKVKVDDRLTILIPKGWRPMDDLDFTERFPSVRAPLAAYSDESRLLDFSVNISATRWLEKDKALAQQFFKAGITNLFDRVDMISEGVADRNGKEFIFFEFESRVNGQPNSEGFRASVLKYNYIQYLIGPSRTLVFSFTCPRRNKEEWQSSVHLMMEGIKVK